MCVTHGSPNSMITPDKPIERWLPLKIVYGKSGARIILKSSMWCKSKQYRGQWCYSICNASLWEKRAFYLNFFISNWLKTGNDFCKNFIFESILFVAFEKLAFIYNSMSMIWKSIRFSKDEYYKCLLMRYFKYLYIYFLTNFTIWSSLCEAFESKSINNDLNVCSFQWCFCVSLMTCMKKNLHL